MTAGGATGITVTDGYDDSDGKIVLSGSDTKAHYESVLQSIRYRNTADPPDPTTRNVAIFVTDGTDPSNTATAHVTVVPLDFPPVLDLNNTDPSLDSSASFTEDMTPPPIAPNADITDSDDTHMESATLTLQSPPDGSNESLAVTIPVEAGSASRTAPTSPAPVCSS